MTAFCFLVLLFEARVVNSLFIPGSGCGTSSSPIRVLEKLPEDPSELAALSCVLTDDEAGYKRLNDAKSGWVDSGWGVCDVSCGGGTKSKTRECRNATHLLQAEDCGGGETTITINCNVQLCTSLEQWQPWSDCSVPCGDGIKTRERLCQDVTAMEFIDIKHCGTGLASTETLSCNEGDCSADGFWVLWSEWSICSVNCGVGTQTRTRTCVQPVGNGADTCIGAIEETQGCNHQPCPVDGYFDTWSIWSDCTQDCGGGVQLRNRLCHPPLYGGDPCQGESTQTEACNEMSCYTLGPWFPWSTCDQACGGGTQFRTKNCLFLGSAVVAIELCNAGSSYQQNQGCNTQSCAADANWGVWSPWGGCDQSCGPGTKERSRSCVGTVVGGGTDYCVTSGESTTDQSDCNVGVCNVDANWLAWSDWSSCSPTCNIGKIQRTRLCDGTASGSGVDYCVPPGGSEEKDCVMGKCAAPAITVAYNTADYDGKFPASNVLTWKTCAILDENGGANYFQLYNSQPGYIVFDLGGQYLVTGIIVKNFNGFANDRGTDEFALDIKENAFDTSFVPKITGRRLCDVRNVPLCDIPWETHAISTPSLATLLQFRIISYLQWGAGLLYFDAVIDSPVENSNNCPV